MKTTTPFMLDYSAECLSHWIVKRAARLAKDIGFSYWPASDAPGTFEGVCAEFKACLCGGGAFRVFDGASDKTIYTNPETNYAFRFWHDVIHAAYKLDFTEQGERATAQKQIDEVSKVFGADSLEVKLITADTAGQVEYFAKTGGFVENQKDFVYGLILAGKV